MSEWIEWKGGVCPVDPDIRVDIKRRHSGILKGSIAAYLRWSHNMGSGDIVAYRLAEDVARLTARIKRLEEALADAIHRPMGVIPASAEGLITQDALRAAEDRRARAAYNGEPDAH